MALNYLSKMKKLIISFIGIMILWFGFMWLNFLHTPLVPVTNKPLDVVFLPGSTVKTFAADLKNKGVLKYPQFFVLLSRLKGVSRELQAGEYKFKPGITASQVLDKMAKGETVMHVFTIVEGWTFRQVLEVLNNNSYLTHTFTGLDQAVIMQRIGEDGKAAEGNFAPDSYFFSGKVADVKILRSAYHLMQKRLMTEWRNRDPQVIYSCPYEALIVASMIEKETADKTEKPLISGVIMRRLQKNMPLQVDAAVIYGLGEKYTGKLHDKDLLQDTSYNTYLHRGLPPTPIAMPSQDSIHAALHPVVGSFLYYVAKGDGTHVFSNTLKKHDRAIRKYLLHRKKK